MKKILSLLLSLCVGLTASAQTAPTFTSEGSAEATFYPIIFTKSDAKQCWTDNSTSSDDVVRCTTYASSDTQLWKFVGSSDNFQIVNKSTGKYVVVSSTSISATSYAGVNSTPLRVSSSQQSGGYSLLTKSGYFEIAANSKGTSTTCNLWGSEGNNNSIGLYTSGDANNKIIFTAPITPDKSESSSTFTVTGSSSFTPENALTLWYTEPGTTATLGSGSYYSRWSEYGLPLGNGQFGAMFLGGIASDQLLFNEKTLWTGKSSQLGTGGNGYGAYQKFGSLYANFLGSSDNKATDYYRLLDLSTATGKVSFKDSQGVTYTREYIASYPAQAIIARYSADQDGKINLRFYMENSVTSQSTAGPSYSDGEGTFSGTCETVSYNARFKVIPTGGTMETGSNGVFVYDADEVLVVLAGGTDFDAYSTNFVSNTKLLASKIQSRVDSASKKSWSDLYNEHTKDYKEYFDRVDFDINNSSNTVTTNTLIDTYSSGSGSNASMLERLYFAYGRYLEISSSRGVDLPSNLQGIWNDMTTPPWNSDIHSNINVQMNYWPAETTNLSDMHLPYLNYIWNMAENHAQWKKYARKTVGVTRGWTCFTENNIFGGGTVWPRYYKDTFYTVANAWYCTHLWQHYRYTLDKDFLVKVFPAMLHAAQYWIDRLVKNSSDGTYEAPDEWSPEQGPKENATAHAQQIIREFLGNTLSAIDVLGQTEAGITDEDLEALKDRYENLDKGLHTETYTGNWGTTNLASNSTILREWKSSSYTSGSNEHRHMSHLMCMYPFTQVYPGTSLFNAAVNSMKLRGDGATGWSMGWKINLWAHALDGDHAYKILKNALAHSNGSGAGVSYNLYDMHPPFQIDGNFGACAGIAEMIMQSNSDTIRILPALPSAWKSGHMTGLKAVKDFTVSVEWANNAATNISIVNNQGQTIPVLYKNLKNATVCVNGTQTTLDVDNNGVAVLSGEKGTTYKFVFNTSSANSTTMLNLDDDLPLSVESTSAAPVAVETVGRTLFVTGSDLSQVRVLDLLGRTVKKTSEMTFTLDATAGHVFIVEITGKQGVTKKKIVM